MARLFLLVALSWCVAAAGEYAPSEPVEDEIASAVHAEAIFRAGRLSEAEPLLEALVAAAPPPPRALILLARIRSAQGRHEEASARARDAVRLGPGDPTVLFWAAGLVGERAERLDLLERYLERSAGEDPSRIESATGSRRMLRALGSRPIWVAVDRPSRVELPLSRLPGPGDRPAGFTVPLTLGGRRRSIQALLDSGSPGLFLEPKSARKGGFRPLAVETVFGGGGSQRHRSQRGLVGKLSLGTLGFSDAMATTSESKLDASGRFSAILGLGVFDGYRITLDPARAVALLELDPGEELPGGSPYWMLAGHLLVEATINDRRSALFLLDTGASTTLISRSLAESLPGAVLGEPAAIDGYGGRREGSRYVEGVRVAFQGVSSPEGPLATVDLSLRNRLLGVEIAGYLGLDALGASTLVIDTRRRSVRLLAVDRPAGRAGGRSMNPDRP